MCMNSMNVRQNIWQIFVTLLWLVCLCADALAIESFPPLVSEGEQLANSPEELAELFKNISRRSEVSSIAFSPDGKKLAIGYSDGNIEIWDTISAKLKQLTGHTNRVNSVVFSSDGKMLVSGSGNFMFKGKESDNSVRVWNIVTGTELKLFEGHTDEVSLVAYSPDGKTLVSFSWDGSVRSWNLTSSNTKPNWIEKIDFGISSMVYSPDGQMLALGFTNGSVQIWNAATGNKLKWFDGHIKEISSIVYNPDGKTLVSVSLDKSVRVWNIATGLEIKRVRHREYVKDIRSLVYNFKHDTLLSCSLDGNIRIWDATTGTELKRFKTHTEHCLQVVYSPDGKIVALRSDLGVQMWDVMSERQLKRLNIPQSAPIWSLAFNPDGKTLALGSVGKVWIWNIDSGHEFKFLKGPSFPVLSIAFSPNGKKLASVFSDSSVLIWNMANENKTKPLQIQGQVDSISSIVFSPDGKMIALSAGDNDVQLWNVESGQELQHLSSVFFNRRIREIEIEMEKYGIDSASFDKMFKEIETALNLNQKLYEIKHKNYYFNKINVISINFSPDGRWLASGSDDGYIRIWDVNSGEASILLSGHIWNNSVIFNHNSRTLVSGGDDNNIKLWDIIEIFESKFESKGFVFPIKPLSLWHVAE